jgi:hypothetical protein
MHGLWFRDRPRLFVMDARAQTPCKRIRLPLGHNTVGGRTILSSHFNLMFPGEALFAAADCVVLLLKHVVTRIRLSGSI